MTFFRVTIKFCSIKILSGALFHLYTNNYIFKYLGTSLNVPQNIPIIMRLTNWAQVFPVGLCDVHPAQ